jgi:MORN repeat variant
MIKLCAILVILGAGQAWSSPLDDLASPNQATRDAAAKTLRETYVPPLRSHWASLLNQLNPSMSEAAITDLLRPYHTHREMGDASGGTGYESYRLDDLWLLQCSMNYRENTLIQATLEEMLRHIWVEPPPKFSGLWITYYVNGQKSNEINYQNGIYFGEFIAYHDDGSKIYVQHYDQSGCDGDDTGYYPSGKVMYRAHYKNGTPVGIWTWYREEGSISSTQDHTK